MKVLQWSTFAIATILGAAAIGFNFQGKDDAQFASLFGGTALALVSAWAEKKSEEPDLMLQMIQAARLDLFEQLLDRRCHQAYEAAVEVQALPPALIAAKYFDWSLIQTNPDKYAHLAIVGGTGDGKTTLTESLLQFLDEKSIAIDPHWKPGNYPGLPTVAKGRNYGEYPAAPIPFDNLVSGKEDCSYTEAIATIHQEMDRRYKLLKKGVPVGDRYTFILDEYTTFAGVHPKCSGSEVLSLIREARKVGLRLILIVQSDLLKDFKWEGQGAARKSLRWARLGEFAASYASGLKDENLKIWVTSQDYPILVDKMPAFLPVPLSPMKSLEAVSNSTKDNHSAIAKYLEDIYQLPGYEPNDRTSDPVQDSSPDAPPGANDAPIDVSESQPSESKGRTGISEVAKEGFPAALLPLHQLAPMIQNLKNERQNQAQIIALLWGISKGGNPKYYKAVEEFKSIQES